VGDLSHKIFLEGDQPVQAHHGSGRSIKREMLVQKLIFQIIIWSKFWGESNLVSFIPDLRGRAGGRKDGFPSRGLSSRVKKCPRGHSLKRQAHYHRGTRAKGAEDASCWNKFCKWEAPKEHWELGLVLFMQRQGICKGARKMRQNSRQISIV